jgi:GPH family glycoside/pentoside/hexuronide:cation symporter
LAFFSAARATNPYNRGMNIVKTSWKEKVFYGFGNMGSYILWAFVATYVTVYVTECLQASEHLIELLGTIILVCRVFDAFSDILMGVLIEKTHSKFGKARLWFGISIIPMLVAFFFIFFFSGTDKFGAIIGISVFYFLFTVIFYTMNNISFNAILPRLTNDKFDQSNVCLIDSIFTSVGGLFSAYALQFLKGLGGESSQSSWTYLILIMIALALVSQVLCFSFVKEKPEIVVNSKERPSRAEMRAGLKSLFKTRYFYVALFMFAINYYLSLSVTSVGKYYAQYVLDYELAYSLFGSVPMVTMGIGLLLTPLLMKKLHKRWTLMIAVGFVFLGNIIGSCFPYSFAAGFTAVMVKGFGSAVVMSQLFTLAPDIVSYVEAKDGIRVEGLAAAGTSFGLKIGSGFGSAMVLWSLS